MFGTGVGMMSSGTVKIVHSAAAVFLASSGHNALNNIVGVNAYSKPKA